MEKERRNEIRYIRLVEAIRTYFAGRDVKYLFLHGGCYYFAEKAEAVLEDSCIMWMRSRMHCGIFFNNGLYDITGRISRKGYEAATEKDRAYMRRHFVPGFSIGELDAYLAGEGVV